MYLHIPPFSVSWCYVSPLLTKTEGHILMELWVLRLCLHEENCRGGTEVSVKITCDVEEKHTFGEALMWP